MNENVRRLPRDLLSAIITLARLPESHDRFTNEATLQQQNKPAFQRTVARLRAARRIDPGRVLQEITRLQPAPSGVQERPLAFNEKQQSQRLSWRRKMTLHGQRQFLDEVKWDSQTLFSDSDIEDVRDVIRQERERTRSASEARAQFYRWVDQRFTMDDIDHLRRQFRLSKAWEFALVEYILTGEMSKPAPRCRVFIERGKDRRKYAYIQVYGNTSLTDIWGIWGIIWEIKRALTSDGIVRPRQRYQTAKTSPLSIRHQTVTSERELFLEFTAALSREDVRCIWPKVQRAQKTLSDYGPSDVRKKPNLARDLECQQLHDEGKHEKEIYDALPVTLKNEIEPETLRQARHRLKLRQKS